VKLPPSFPKIVLFLLVTFLALFSFAADGGRVSGTVADPTGAVIPGAAVVLRNAASGAQTTAQSGADGSYTFVNVVPGSYEIAVTMQGFQPFHDLGIDIAGADSLRFDVQLSLAKQSEVVEVSSSILPTETDSAQNGGLITARNMTAVPLNGRSFTDLLAMQPGVVPASSSQPNAVVMSGCTATPPSGDLNAGNLSVSGQRETANGFSVNGSTVEEDFNNGTAIVPNLDAIQGLRVLTNNTDAEYGNYSGGQVIVDTKSGTNQIHGDVFEFLRNTNLDARNYLATTRAAYDRNQYGATLGGPIRKDKAFFFVDYQGTQMTQGQETGYIVVPTLADRSGNLGDLASQLTGKVSSTYWANQLAQKLGYTVQAGEPYYSVGCTTSSQCVFPNAVIPTSIWSTPARNLLQYIPTPNIGTNLFSDAAQNETLNDSKAAARFDFVTQRFGSIFAYYLLDQFTMDNPYPTEQGGANVPGFNALSDGRAQLFSFGDVKTFGANTVNEAHFSYMRFANVIGQPAGGVGPTLASQGFVSGEGTLGIVPLNKSIEGIENVAFNDFTIGVDVTGERQVNNTWSWSDSLSHVVGHHTLKLGGSFHLDQININSNSINNGSFVFQGTETGSDFADYLLGIATTYEQGDARPFYLRNHYTGLFAQDSWQVRPNLTLSYGVRWDVLPPWSEKYNQIQTFVLGEQSRVYPNAPTGIVFPGDPGIPSTLAPTKWTNFAPRLGLAYSPNFNDGLLGKVFGGAGKSSIRAGYGIFYNAFEGLSAGIMSACAPYGYDYDSTGGRPLFSEPFVSATTGLSNGQPFPSPMPPFGASASNPNTSVDWAKYEPITGDPAFYYGNTSPYTESYTLSLERELATNTYLSVGYVGSQSHHLLVLTSANPGDAAACLGVSEPSEVMPGTATCGPFSEGGVFTKANGQQIVARSPFSSYFDGITYQKTIGFSNYNALEVSLRRTGRNFDLSAGYTYSKSLDDSSSLSEPVYPFDAGLTKAISAFDLRHNFVVNYRYQLPFTTLFRSNNRWSSGWWLSGITHISSGLPVTLYNNTDSSLLGSMPNGINNNGVDTPEFTGGNLAVNTNPRNGLPAFNTALFSVPALGALGNAPRRFFYGPGMANFDMALQKEFPIRESKVLQFRVEAFNVFNHAQFFGAAAVNGNISSTGFGQIVNAMPPREVQLAMRFNF
jgi:hypothetical protein